MWNDGYDNVWKQVVSGWIVVAVVVLYVVVVVDGRDHGSSSRSK